MKRILCFLLAVIMMLCLCGCGNKEEIESVIGLIDNIGSVSADSEKSILSARTAFDALSDKDKQKVSNIETLITAENTFAPIKEKAVAVEKIIDSIGDYISNGVITEEGLSALLEARLAYNELSDDEKKLVSNYDVLTKANQDTCAYIIEGINSFVAEHNAESALNLCKMLESLTEDEKEYRFAEETSHDVLLSCYAGTRFYQLPNVVSVPVVRCDDSGAKRSVIEQYGDVHFFYDFENPASPP